MARPRGESQRKGDRSAVPAPEFSRRVDVSRMGRLEHRTTVTATPEERAALARRFDLLELADLAGNLVLKKRGDGVIELSGTCRARLAQASVVSLEPVWATLEDDIRVYFTGNMSPDDGAGDPLNDEDWPEPIIDGHIDLGEALAQWLAVSIDPYPRLPEEA